MVSAPGVPNRGYIYTSMRALTCLIVVSTDFKGPNQTTVRCFSNKKPSLRTLHIKAKEPEILVHWKSGPCDDQY